MLTHAGTTLFAPVVAVVVLLSTNSQKSQVWRTALAVLFSAAVVISPWTLRNYFTFHQLVPVRNGLGINAYMGNCALIKTFRSDLVDDKITIKPPWTANGAFDAFRLVHITDNRRQLRYYALKIVEATAPEGYTDFNEAERDKVFLQQTEAFMLANPIPVVRLFFIKTISYFFTKFRYRRLPLTGVVAVLGVVGLLMSFKDCRVRVLGLLALAYSAPYLVTINYWYRYRYPTEPLIAVLAGIGLVRSADLFSRWRSRQADSSENRA
jgi:hypothetical protein